MSKEPVAESSTSAPKVGELVPQPHGGALRHGGTNSGGPGRPPSAIRHTIRRSFGDRVRILEEIADDQDARDTDRIKAVDVLGKYGLGSRDTWDRESVVHLMRLLGAAVEHHVKDGTLLEEIRHDWLAILAAGPSRP